MILKGPSPLAANFGSITFLMRFLTLSPLIKGVNFDWI